MERDQLVRNDFPRAHGVAGFDVDSVGAHLSAVAAHVAALEARIAALEIERDRLQEQLADAREHQEGPSGLPDPVERAPASSSGEPAGSGADRDRPGEDSAEALVAARLLASKLAMEGKERDSIVMQVAAEHDVADPAELVDEVLARLG